MGRWEGGDICICMANSHCCTAETKKKTVKQLSSPIKKIFKQTNKLHGRAESSDLALGGHESAFSLIGGFLTKTNFPSTNNCLLDTEASYTKVFLMMKITLHDLTPKGRKIQDKVKSH